MAVDIPEEPTVRQLYNSWGTQKKLCLKDKQQGVGLTTTQFIAELTYRVKKEEAFVAFSPTDLDDLCEYVRALFQDNEDTPNAWGTVLQTHIKDWTMIGGGKLSRPHKQQFIAALQLVNMDPTYTQLVFKATRDAALEVAENAELCEKDMYDRLDSTMTALCGALACEIQEEESADVDIIESTI
jgi:hypothetical protein